MDLGIKLRLEVQILSLSLGKAGRGKGPRDGNAAGPGQWGRRAGCPQEFQLQALPTALSPRGSKGRRRELLLDKDLPPRESRRQATPGVTVGALEAVSASIHTFTNTEVGARRGEQVARSDTANLGAEPEHCLLPCPVICAPSSSFLTPCPNAGLRGNCGKRQALTLAQFKREQAWRNEVGH